MTAARRGGDTRESAAKRRIGRMGYLPQLDGVRAVAVTAVLLSHAQFPLTKGGGVGVDIFFVLSGFLITSLLIEEFAKTDTISLPAFYMRRARRLLPALFVVAAVSALGFALVRPIDRGDTFLGIAAGVLYVSAWLRAFHVSLLGWFGHTWSLSVEEHFYLVWPFALRKMFRRNFARMQRYVFIALGVAVVYKLAFILMGASTERLINSPDLRADQLLAGCALATLLPPGHSRAPSAGWRKVWTVAVALCTLDLAKVVVAPTLLGVNWYRDFSTVIGIECAVIIGYLVVYQASPLTKLLSHRLPVWIGRRSYGIYLWHLPLLGLLSLKGQPERYRLVARLVAIALTYVAAWASFKWVETRVYRRRVEVEPERLPEPLTPAEVESAL